MSEPIKPRPFVNRLAAALVAATVLVTSTHARADDDEVPDARIAGYPAAVNTAAVDLSQKTSSAASFAVLAFLAVVTVGFMFKNANRTPLD